MRYIKIFNTPTDYDNAKKCVIRPHISAVLSNDTVHYNNFEVKYFTTVAIDDNIEFSFKIPAAVDTTYVTSMSYSIDEGETWTTVNNTANDVTIKTPIVRAGDRVLWKGIAKSYAKSGSNNYFSQFYSMRSTTLKRCTVEGNIMSLLYGDDFIGQTTFPEGSTYTFCRLFWKQYNTCNPIHAKNLILPATTLVSSCYTDMFIACTQLRDTPELPATTLANYCYQGMFYGCTSLTTPPELPATTLTDYCYSQMFLGCTSLITPPELPATQLANNCYSSMFNGCTSLITPPELPATTLAQRCYSNMFDGCTSFTIAPELRATTLVEGCYNGIVRNTNVLPDVSNIDFTSSSVVRSGGLQGLFAGTKVTYNDLLTMLPLNENNKPCLPVNSLSSSCYSDMFANCKLLTEAPKLPANSINQYSYSGMFQGCIALTVPPELPAQYGGYNCYYQMFYGCTSLTTAPAINFSSLTNEGMCYQMFYGCTSLTTAPALPYTTLKNYCYYQMFYGCTSLTTAPDLPATTLTSSCYNGMFNGCTSLNYIKMLATNISATNCLNNWVKSVASTGTFVKNSAAAWNVTGDSGIPSGWTVQTASA